MDVWEIWQSWFKMWNFLFEFHVSGKKTWVDKYLIICEDKRTSECELFNCSELFYFMLLQSNSRLIVKPADPICKKGQMNKFTKKLNTLLPQQWSRTVFSVVLPICTAHCLLNSVTVKLGCDQIPRYASQTVHFPTWYSKSDHFPIEIPIKNKKCW